MGNVRLYDFSSEVTKERRRETKRITKITLGLGVILFLLAGCSSHPKITLEKIHQDIVGRSTDEGVMSWTFDKRLPMAISIADSKYEGDKATIIIGMKTSAPAYIAIPARELGGKLRLHYEWIANEWNLIRIENLTFKVLD